MKNNPTKFFSKITLLALVIALAITGCSSNKADPKSANQDKNKPVTTAKEEKQAEGNTMQSSDGSVQITLKDGWLENKNLNDLAVIGAANILKKKYVMVIPISKSSLSKDATLEDFKELFSNNNKLALKNYTEVESQDITIDSQPAKLVEFYGSVQEIDVHYLTGLVGKGNTYYQVITWSTEKDFPDHKSEFLDIINSLKILKETNTSNQTLQTTDDTTTIEDKDKTISIDVPKNWSEDLSLSDEATLQASRPASEDYLVILREKKTDLPAGVTLNKYLELITTNMKSGLVNPQHTEAKSVTINGVNALQCELSGEINKIKVTYLLTAIASNDHFTQILLWTRTDMMKDKRENYAKIANTFKEL